MVAGQLYQSTQAALHDGDANARQVFAALRGAVTTGSELQVDYDGPSLLHPPPSAPNSWSDGSVMLPASSYTLAGAAVWHPIRSLDHEPLTGVESQVSFVEDSANNDGTALLAALPGSFFSSTRAEIAGGILAALRPASVHLGVDSKAFADVAKTIIAHKGLVQHWRKPIGLYKDGDLLIFFARLVMQRGASHTMVSWHKGHANATHLKAGTATADSLQHNPQADRAAKLSITTGYPEGALELGFYLQQLGSYMTVLFTRIHALILRVLDKDKSLRLAAQVPAGAVLAPANTGQTPASKGMHKKVLATHLLPTRLEAPGLEHGIPLDLHGPFLLGLTTEEIHVQLLIWFFFKHTRWRATSSSQNGSSWVEVFAWFQALGGHTYPKLVDDDGSLALPHFKQQLLDFSRHALRFLSRCAAPADVLLFRPAKDKQHRLAPFGITMHVPCISAVLCLAPEGCSHAQVQDANSQQAALSQARTSSSSARQAFLEGCTTLGWQATYQEAARVSATAKATTD